MLTESPRRARMQVDAVSHRPAGCERPAGTGETALFISKRIWGLDYNVEKLPWFRMYYEARTDQKLATLTDSEHRVWFKLLCYAAEQEDRGIISGVKDHVIAIEAAGGDHTLLNGTLQKLLDLDMIAITENALRFVHFNERNYDYPSDQPAAIGNRVRKHREMKRLVTSGNDIVTTCNAVEERRGEENRVEVPPIVPQRGTRIKASRTPELQEVIDLWRTQGYGKVSMRAETRLKSLIASTGKEYVQKAIRRAAAQNIAFPMSWIEQVAPSMRREDRSGQQPRVRDASKYAEWPDGRKR